MHIIIDDYGVQLEKEENMFLLKLGQQVRTISPVKVTAIHIYKTAVISSAAILMAAENNIPMLFYDSSFKPGVRTWHSNFSSTGHVRVMQPQFCKSSAGLWWCRRLVLLKMEGELHNLSFFANRFTAVKEAIEKAVTTITKIKDKINAEAAAITADTLRGYEGVSTAAYWQALDALLDDTVFTKRIKRNPKDPFNAAVNYLYGILYGKVESGLLSYGLDPMVGMMHAEGYSKKSLVYDCIEPFRPWAELLLVTLFKNETLTPEHFKPGEESAHLEKPGRKLLVTAFNVFLTERTLMNKRRVSRNDQVIALCSSLAQAVKNHNPAKP